MRDACGTPDRPTLTAGFTIGPGGNVWPKRNFTYAFDPSRPCSDAVSEEDARDAVRRAFHSWEKGGAELTFAEVSIDDDPDFAVQWVSAVHSEPGGEHDKLGVQADGVLPHVAHAPYPPALTEVDYVPRFLCFDDEDYEWVIAPDDDGGAGDLEDGQQDIEEVAVHEIGHLLGLGHSTAQDSVMQVGVRAKRSLGTDDIDGIQELYPPQGRVRFNAVWDRDDDLPRKALQKIVEADLGDLLRDQRDAGWRPVRITSYAEPGDDRRYNVVLEQTDQPRRWSFGKSKEEFDRRHDELEAEGLSLLSINSGGDGTAWSGVWADNDDIKHLNGTSNGDLDHAGEGFEKLLRDIVGAGLPLDIDTHLDGDTLRWNVILTKGDPDQFRIQLGLSWDEFLEELDDVDPDWAATAVSAYLLPDGRDRWNLVTQARDHHWRVRAGYGGYDMSNEIIHLEADDFQPKMLNTFVLPPPVGSAASLSSAEVTLDPPPDTLVPESLDVAVAGNRVYATRYLRTKTNPPEGPGDGVLVVADRNSLEVVHPGIPVGHAPGSVAVNPVTNRIYVVNAGQKSYSLTAIDGATHEVLATIELKQAPKSVAVNPTTNRIYVSNWFQGRVHVIDGDSHQVLPPIDLGRGILGLDVDPARNQIYAAITNRSFAPFRTGFVRITDNADDSAYGVEPFVAISPLGSQPIDVAVDGAHDRVYVACLGGGGTPPAVSVRHRASLSQLALIPIPGPARSIAMNPDTREVFVATDRGTVLVDGASDSVVRVIDQRAGWSVVPAGSGARQLFVATRAGVVVRLS